MKNLLILISLTIIFGSTTAQVDHSTFDKLLKSYVSSEGKINYEEFNKSVLKQYLQHLSDNPPINSWSNEETLAFWINAYNAFTINLILEHYPLKSIKDIAQPWDIKFIRIGEKMYSLNEIEHEIIRKKFDEPRIHFALFCPAVSCPELRQEAYVAKKIDKQLQDQSVHFLNNPEKNNITEQELKLSQLFNWFAEDFTKEGTIIDFVNKFQDNKVSPDAKLSFLEYDWGLND